MRRQRSRSVAARTSSPNDGRHAAAIGTVQTAGLAIGFLFLSLNHAVLAGPESLLFGTVLGVTQAQVLGLPVVAVATLAILALVARPLLLPSLDPKWRAHAACRCWCSTGCSW